MRISWRGNDARGGSSHPGGDSGYPAVQGEAAGEEELEEEDVISGPNEAPEGCGGGGQGSVGVGATSRRRASRTVVEG